LICLTSPIIIKAKWYGKITVNQEIFYCEL